MSSAPRLRRLQVEYDDMQRLQQASSLISFSTVGTPPTQYSVRLACLGLFVQENVLVLANGGHMFDILLGPSFPLLAPNLVWKTPIFHPNFLGHAVCLGDFWYPGWSLAEMCITICEMVQYKSYNIYDPLDKEAALWLKAELDESPERFPVDKRPVRDLDFNIAITKDQDSDGLEDDR